MKKILTIFMVSLTFLSVLGLTQTVNADSSVIPQKVADHTGTNKGNYKLPTLSDKIGSDQGVVYPYVDQNTVTNWDVSTVDAVSGNGAANTTIIPKVGSSAIISNAMKNDSGEIFDLRITITDIHIQNSSDYKFSTRVGGLSNPAYANWYFALGGISYYNIQYDILQSGTQISAPAQNIIMVSSDLDYAEFLVTDSADGFFEVAGSKTAIYKMSNGKFIAGNGGGRRLTNSEEPFLTQQQNYDPYGFAGWYTENSSSFNLGYAQLGEKDVPVFDDNNSSTVNDSLWHYFDTNADGMYDMDMLERDSRYPRSVYAQGFLPGAEKMGSVLIHYVQVTNESQDPRTGTKLADDFWNYGIVDTAVGWPVDREFDGLDLIKNTKETVTIFKENQQEVWLVYMAPVDDLDESSVAEVIIEAPNTGYKLRNL